MPHAIHKWQMSQFLLPDKARRGIWAVSGGDITLQNMRKYGAGQVLPKVRGRRGLLLAYSKTSWEVVCDFPKHHSYKCSHLMGLLQGLRR